MGIVATSSPRVPRSFRGDCGPSWRDSLRRAVRDPGELCRLLQLPESCLAGIEAATREFPLFVPREYLARMRPGDPADPLLLQVLPRGEETDPRPGTSLDPVGDRAAELVPGLLHKYESRVLLIVTGACAVHCRYCFRRHFPYDESPKSLAAWEPALEKIAADDSIREVILSGGDPLTLVDESLAPLAARLAEIPQLRRLRIHTRLPIMIPGRVTDELLAWLGQSRLTPIVVVHANHAAELDEAVAGALGRLRGAGIALLNQAVLLAGVNDSLAAQVELCERLVDLGVLPYYLHQLDRVRGAAHYEVPIETGERLIAELRSRLPGYAVPRFVREVAGGEHKLVLA